MRVLLSATLLLIGTFLIVSPQTQAKSYLGVSQDFVYDTNPLLLSSGEDSIFGSETRAFLDFSRETPRQSLNGRATVIQNEFDDSAFNSTDFVANANYQRRSLRWALSANGSFKYDTTRSGETSTLGRTNRSDRYLTWRFRPKIDYTVSQRTQASIQTEIVESRYDNNALIDYRTISITPSLATQLSPVQTMMTSVQARRYKSLDGATQVVDSIGPSVGWIYNFNPRYSVQAFAGFLASQFENIGGGDNDWEINPTYSLNLNYAGQRNKTMVGITRTREPFSNGSEYDLTRLSGENRFTINPLWSLTTKASYQMAEDPEFATDDLDEAWDAGLTLRYNPSENWEMTLTQNYTNEKLLSGRKADRNIIRLGLTYNFGKTR